MAAAALSLLLAAALMAGVTGLTCTSGDQHVLMCGPGDVLGDCTAGVWTPVVNCQILGGQVCIDGDNKCSDGSAVPANCPGNPSIYCSEATLYPDLNDCQQYHDCTLGGTESVCYRCPSGYAFDACKRSCTKPLGIGGCPQNGPRCRNFEDIGTAPGNSRLYYVCASNLQPYWSECHNSFFDLATRRCTTWDIPGSACTPCQGPGLRPLPNSDCGYLACNSDGSWKEQRCSSGWHFSTSAGACVLGACSAA